MNSQLIVPANSEERLQWVALALVAPWSSSFSGEGFDLELLSSLEQGQVGR